MVTILDIAMWRLVLSFDSFNNPSLPTRSDAGLNQENRAESLLSVTKIPPAVHHLLLCLRGREWVLEWRVLRSRLERTFCAISGKDQPAVHLLNRHAVEDASDLVEAYINLFKGREESRLREDAERLGEVDGRVV